tara:strand:+ start:753 stop:1301 length:549 start_codon:yes stop_codon:yes gene_type:complete
MGIIIKADLDTNNGSTNKAYASIRTFTVNRERYHISYNVQYFLNKNSVQKPTYIGEDIDYGSISPFFSPYNIIFYKGKGKFEELNLIQNKKLILGKSKTISIPIYEELEKIKEVPFITFDQDGNEVEIVRHQKVKVKEKVGSEKVKKEIIDESLIENPLKACYEDLEKELIKVFGKKNIIKD